MNTEANRIKDRLRACTTAQEVRDVADEERAAVLAMADKTQQQQVVNLKAFTLAGFKA